MSIIVVKGNTVSTVIPAKQMTGEKIPGDLSTWDYLGTDPNIILTYKYDVLSQRATTLFHTHAPVSAAINKLTCYAIGPGLLFRSHPDWEILEIDKEYAKNWSMRFQKLIHYSFKMLNFYEKQSILFRTALIMGDSLLFFDRSQSEGQPFDLIETGGDQINFLSDKQKTTLGIMHDDLLRRKGIVKQDGTPVNFVDANGDQNVIQFYLKKIARQLRGYPLPYKIIAAAKNNDRWWDATLARAVLESMMFGTTQEETSDTYRQMTALADDVRNEDGTKPSSGLASADSVANTTPGSILSYRGGEGFNLTDLKTPSNNFDKFQSAYIDIVGMATDVPPEVVMSKYSTSFTAHKGALNDFVRSYKEKRRIFENNVIKRVIIEIAKYLFLEELIEMPHKDFFTNGIIQEAMVAGKYLGPVPGHVNPLQEVKAIKEAIDGGLMLRSDGAAQFENEYDNMIAERESEEREFYNSSVQQKVDIMTDELDNPNFVENNDIDEDGEE